MSGTKRYFIFTIYFCLKETHHFYSRVYWQKQQFNAMVKSESDKLGLEFNYTNYYLDIFNM